MSAALPLRDDFNASMLRRLERKCRDNRQLRRLLSLAAVYGRIRRHEPEGGCASWRDGVACSENAVSGYLVRLGFSRISGRPQHPAQAPEVIDAFKNTWACLIIALGCSEPSPVICN
jgi:hypothetical protein